MAEIAANRARSKEGHAAMSMKGGQNDRWVEIQRNTFTNWVNEQLRQVDTSIEDLQTDLCDGVKLCRLVEVLREERIARVINKPFNQHQSLENVTLALHAVSDDNVRLVNIGNEDIVNSNLKLIMGLIWHLILRYQIGKTKFPAKRLMLAWLRAVIPECNITNFTTNWNDGVALHALIDYCEPGLCPNWRTLDRSDRLNNCRDAMTLAKQHFDIPLVLRPEDLSSDDLDDLSGMTYLSYYMKVDSPGYNATMKGVRNILKNGDITNFTIDWADGQVLRNIVRSLGENMPDATGDHVTDIQNGLEGGRKLAVEPLLSAKDFAETAETEEDHIGIMAYAAYFTRLTPVRSSGEKLVLESQPKDSYVGNECSFRVQLEDPNVSPNDVRAEVIGPDSTHSVKFEWLGRTAEGSFTPIETGHHKLNVFCENEAITGSPVSFKVSADRSKVTLLPIDACAVGTMTELKVNSAGAGQGDVRIEARAPSGHTLNLPAVFRNDVYVANFTPTEVGDYDIIASYDGEPVGSGQQTVHSFDPSAVKIHGLEGGSVGSAVIFHADIQNAGRGVLRCDVAYQGNQIPSYIAVESSGEHSVEFTPQGAGIYNVHVFYNDIEVRGSPYDVDIVDSSMVSVSGNGLTLVPVNKTASFNVNTSGGSGKVDVDITGPNGRSVPSNITQTGYGQEVEYIPTDVGDHQIEVKYDGRYVEGSPCVAKTYDTSAINVTELRSTIVGNSVEFFIDVSRAGEGQLEIMVNDGTLPNTVDSETPGVYRITFVPERPGKQYVEIHFNRESVPGSPFTCSAVDTAGTSVRGMPSNVPIHKMSSFIIHTEGEMDADLAVVDIYSADGSKVASEIRDSGSGSYSVEFLPEQIGDHLVNIVYAGVPISGSPFTVKTFNPDLVSVDINSKAVRGEPCILNMDMSEAGEGKLEMIVRHNGISVESAVREAGQSQVEASFIPQDAGDYEIDLRYNDEIVKGSPFLVGVEDDVETVVHTQQFDYIEKTDTSRARSVRTQPIAVSIQKEQVFKTRESQWFLIQGGGEDIAVENLDIVIRAPNAEHIHSEIQPQTDGNYKVEWTPLNAGRHTVEVQYAGSPVDGSPYGIDVFDLSAIHVDGLRKGAVGEEAGFNVEYLPWSVDFSSTGSMQNQIHIVSPSGKGLDYDIHDIGHLKKQITYIPEESGTHEIFITYGGYDLPGCPYIQHIDDGGSVVAQGDGLYHGEEDKPAVFYVDTGRRKGNLEVKVDGPNSVPKYSMEPQSDGSYTVTYIPVEVGLFDLSVIWNGKEIQGSPFHPRVVDPRKVRVIDGWHHYLDSKDRITLSVHEEKQLPFDVSEAGPGNLRAEVSGPSQSIPVTVDDHTFGKATIIFTPEEEGNHYIHIFWSNIPIVESPFRGFAAGVRDNKVVLTGRGLKEAVVREKAEFVIDGSNAGQGEPQVTLQGFKAEVEVNTLPLGAGRFRCNYIPSVPGAYLLHIQWNGRQLRGSPYKVNVTGAFYHNKVVVTGEGLRGAALGRDMDVHIDTRKAGPGELTASCMGPHKAGYCELEDHQDGTFRLSIKPQEPGKHLLQIKYGGEHVIGSPYIVRVSQQPDASKVRVTGPGVEHGILATFQSRFIVETRGAGAGQLTVRIRGPKGAFQVEMYRDSQRDRTILCRYDPTETGLYIINVKWSGVDVPGSAFHVQIVDTQQELEQVLQDASFSGSPLSSPRTKVYNQWREDM